VFFCWDTDYRDAQVAAGNLNRSTWDANYIRIQVSMTGMPTGCFGDTGSAT